MKAKEEFWYLALTKLHIPNGPNSTPSSLRLEVGQRFALDGDEPVDVESLLRIGAIKIYEESDRGWADGKLNPTPEPTRRRRSRG